MLPESAISILIIIHAVFGGLGLMAGTVSIASKKGGFIHKKSGLLFVISMLISTIISMIVAVQPNHLSTFLFSIGVLSIYFVLSGYSSLRYKRKSVSLLWDRCLATGTLVIGLGMLSHPLFLGHINIVMMVLGALGVVFPIRDFMLFRKPEKLSKHWLTLHIGKIMGGYISAFTAFIVVNQFIPGIFGWLAPGVVGGIVIGIWISRVKNGTAFRK